MDNLRKFCMPLLFWFVAVAIMFSASAQPKANEESTEAELVKIIANSIEELHYTNPTIDDQISALLFEEYLKRLDPNHYFFRQSDIQEFSSSRYELDDMIKKGDARFAFLVHERFLQRVEERIAYLKKVVNEPFDFTKDETIVVKREQEQWPKDIEEQNNIWLKEVKNHLLKAKLKEIIAREKQESIPTENPKEEFIRRYERYYKFMKNNDHYDILEYYLASLAEIFDPHTTYLNWRTLSDFEISLSLSLEGIGAVLTNDDGNAKIVRIIPGGPADKHGELKAGYLIIGVGQEGEPIESIVDMPLNKAVQKIRGKKGTKVTLKVLKTIHDLPFDIVITRDEIKLTEQAAIGKVREIPMENGAKARVGIVYLPSFYSDFADSDLADPNALSTLRDMRKIIDEMVNNSNIDGLIMDLRGNGGGSLEEAIDFTGLFIPSGPVVQIKAGDTRRVRRDRDKGFAYEMPLIVMVDAFSASASEIFAAAIQDYGRGIIVGQRTYGKGTVQNLLTLERVGIPQELKPGALKFTMAKFYRITGGSTQHRGVLPDIVFPSFFTAEEYGEPSLDHVMPWDEIASLDFKRSKAEINRYVAELQKKHANRMQENKKFQELEQYIQRWNKSKQQKTISLNLDQRLALQKEEDLWYERIEAMLESSLDPETREAEKTEDMYLEETLLIMRDLLLMAKSR